VLCLGGPLLLGAPFAHSSVIGHLRHAVHVLAAIMQQGARRKTCL
jgi:hypothetical protein